MADTIELIIRHTQELDEYMNKNGKYSFYRFSDGSIHYIASLFNDISRIEDTCLVPIEPVEELEELKKAIVVKDTLVTINGFVEFAGEDAILGETGIEFYGLIAEIKYTGIHSLIIDFHHDLKELFRKIKKGYFGETVYINGFKRNVGFLKVEENGISILFPDGNVNKHTEYDDVFLISDSEERNIYWR
jgi:hypothetical protein